MKVHRTYNVDRNQAAIVETLRDYDCEVSILADAGRGIPDLLVLVRADWWTVECKMPGEGLTPAQVIWHERNKRARRNAIVFGTYDALVKLGLVRHDREAA